MIAALENAMKPVEFYMHGITTVNGMETELLTFKWVDGEYSYFREGKFFGYYRNGGMISEEEYQKAFDWAKDQYYVAM